MAVKLNDFEIKNLEVKVEKNGDNLEVVAKNGEEVFKNAIDEAGLKMSDYEKAYKFDQQWVKKLVHWSTDESEKLFKKHKDAGTIEFKMPLNHKYKDETIKKDDRLEIMVFKDVEVPAGKPGEKNEDGSRPMKKATKIAIKAHTHRYSFSKTERKKLEQNLRNKILGD